jgi:hypothetical protein
MRGNHYLAVVNSEVVCEKEWRPEDGLIRPKHVTTNLILGHKQISASAQIYKTCAEAVN